MDRFLKRTVPSSSQSPPTKKSKPSAKQGTRDVIYFQTPGEPLMIIDSTLMYPNVYV